MNSCWRLPEVTARRLRPTNADAVVHVHDVIADFLRSRKSDRNVRVASAAARARGALPSNRSSRRTAACRPVGKWKPRDKRPGGDHDRGAREILGVATARARTS
jgi:hypothetical protein